MCRKTILNTSLAVFLISVTRESPPFVIEKQIHKTKANHMILELIQAIENEEQRSLVEDIYHRYFDRMYRIGLQILNHHHDAEDAAMETIKKIIDHVDQFLGKDHTEIIAMVVIYTRNTARSMYRKRQRSRTVSTTFDSEETGERGQVDIPDESEDVQRLVINSETIRMMEHALQQLSPEQRDIILLRYYFGYPYSEIAKAMEIDENAARTRVHRIRQKLKTVLGDDAYERISF